MLPVRFNPHRELFFCWGGRDTVHSETEGMRFNIVASASDFLKTFAETPANAKANAVRLAGTPANTKANAAGLAGLPQTPKQMP